MKALYVSFFALALIATTSAGKIAEARAAASSSEEVPTVPGDNSHYVEGKSRYVWIPDGEGEPHLVDLHENVTETTLQDIIKNGADNQYWLFTRSNPHQHQVLIHGNRESVTNSNYRTSRTTKVIVHGWRSSGNANINVAITSAFLVESDCNVIVVDWSRVASGFNYPGASAGVPNVGEHVGKFVSWILKDFGGNWFYFHFVGHSLGAHVVGNAGKITKGSPKRVTGLDPAGPLWANNVNALSKRAGEYVEVIHTDGGVLGLLNNIGHADFYPNGGKNPQPGCWLSTCSHSRSYELFAASIQLNRLIGRACTDIKQAEENQCNGAEFHMGNAIVNKNGSGIYGLGTHAHWPY